MPDRSAQTPSRRIALALWLAVAATLPLAASAQDAAEDRFIDIVAKRGCQMTEDAAEYILPGYGMTMEETEDLVGRMIDRGVATFDGEILTLDAGICTPTTDPADLGPREKLLLEAVRKAGCSMTEDEAAATLPGQGMRMEEAEALAGQWIATGLATFDDERLTLSDAYCAAAPARKAPAERPAPAGPSAKKTK